MRIAIVTSGRFHVLDLARELAALGHEVAFYSYVPRSRAKQFGLPTHCHRSLLRYLAPLVGLVKVVPNALKNRLDPVILMALDSLVACILEPCDVFVGMSGLCVKSARAAREKFGARIFLERGSRHILSQKEILENIPVAQYVKRPSVSAFIIQRELAGYELANVIVVPSHHAQESFVERGVSRSKLFRNPYGVDLAMFPPTPAPPSSPPTILFVGVWSLQKGCDVLSDAWQKLPETRLMHVGPAGDAAFPQHPSFVHHDPVPQWKLKEFFSQAHVFALASRQDGFGMVLSQALACGLPVVCTTRTGGEDLREFLANPSLVSVVPPDDPAALASALRLALRQVQASSGLRDNLRDARVELSWSGYGQRYDDFLRGPIS